MSKDAIDFWSNRLDQKGRLRYCRYADVPVEYAEHGWASMPREYRSAIGKWMNIRRRGFIYNIADDILTDGLTFPNRGDETKEAQDQWTDILATIIRLNGGYISKKQMIWLVQTLKIPRGLADIQRLQMLGFTFKSIIPYGNGYTWKLIT